MVVVKLLYFMVLMLLIVLLFIDHIKYSVKYSRNPSDIITKLLMLPSHLDSVNSHSKEDSHGYHGSISPPASPGRSLASNDTWFHR